MNDEMRQTLHRYKVKKRSFVHDLFLACVALLITLILWSYLKNEETVFKNIYMDLKISKQPDSLMLRNELNDKLMIKVYGTKSKIEKIVSDLSTTYAIDMANAHAGINTHFFDFKKISILNGVKIEKIVPEYIQLDFDQAFQKNVPVQAGYKGQLNEAYELEGKEISPQFVTIKGPESLLRNINKLSTVDVDLSRIQDSMEQELPIVSPSGQIVLSKDKVLFKIKLKEKNIEKEWLDIKLSYDVDKYQFKNILFKIKAKALFAILNPFDKKNIVLKAKDIDKLKVNQEQELQLYVDDQNKNIQFEIEPKFIKIKRLK